MRRLFRASQSAVMLAEAAKFVQTQSRSGSVIILGATRGAADDFVRRQCGSVAGVHRFSLAQLVAHLTAEPMAERGLAPVNALACEALAARSIYRVLHEARLEYFEPVAQSPGFPRALSRTLQELRMEGLEAKDIAPSGKPGYDIATLKQAYEEALREGRLTDFAAMIRLAGEALESHPLSRASVLLLDLPVWTNAEATFVSRLANNAPEFLAVMTRGDEASLRRLNEALQLDVEDAVEVDNCSLSQLRQNLFSTAALRQRPMDESLDLFSAAGEGLECTEIARRIHECASNGVKFDGIGVLLRAPERYQALLEEAFYRAGIPFHFTRGSVRPDPAGRAFLALLACAMEGYTATRFAEFLSLGQLRPAREARTMAANVSTVFGTEDELLGREDTVAETEEVAEVHTETPLAWEKLIVDAAVVGGKDRWRRRLQGLENEYLLRLARLSDESGSDRAFLERQLTMLRELQRIALPVIEQLDELPKSALWEEWVTALSNLAHATLRNPDSVVLALNELWSMKEVGPVTLDEVSQVLTDRLRVLRRKPKQHRYGKVWIGSIEEARGYSFEAVFLPGLAEGIFPKKAFEDPLLLDEARRQIGGQLPLLDDRVAKERLQLRIAAGVARERIVISYPRMDVAQHRPRVPSFYAMETIRAAEGGLPELKMFERRAAAGSRTRLGWPAPDDPMEAVDDLEYDLSILQAAFTLPMGKAQGRGRYLVSLSKPLYRSLIARHRRWEKKWSSADGLIDISTPTKDILKENALTVRPWSASSLQHFAACPYRFYLHGILQLRRREESVALEQMDPLTRGSLFHEVVFHLFQRVRNAANFAAEADRVFDEIAAKYKEELAPAIPRVWMSEIEDLRADLHGWLRRIPSDGKGWEVQHSEYAFGLKDDAGRDPESTPQPAHILGGMMLRGSVDWIEQSTTADCLRITDHKTGRAPKQRHSHVGGGSTLQPLLYAAALQDRLAKTVKSSRLYYCTQRGNFTVTNFDVTDQAMNTMHDALEIIQECMGAAFLPASPAKDQCGYCDYRVVCGPREEERTGKKELFPQLASLRSLP